MLTYDELQLQREAHRRALQQYVLANWASLSQYRGDIPQKRLAAVLGVTQVDVANVENLRLYRVTTDKLEVLVAAYKELANGNPLRTRQTSSEGDVERSRSA